MDTALATLLTTLAVNASLDRRLSPDACAQVFLDAGHPVPLVIEDEVYATDPPTGLLLLIPALRSVGVDRLRIALIHPSLPFTVPRVDKPARRRIARSTAVAIAEVRHTSHSVLTLDGEANVGVFACAPVPYATLDVISVPESARALREVVIDGLELIDGLGAAVPTEIRNLQWRDWQADMSAEAQRSELAALLRHPAQAPLLHAALDIHHAMSPILAPAAVQPPELGSLLSRLHTAAASVVTAVSRDNGIG
jgi:hypothetical protein